MLYAFNNFNKAIHALIKGGMKKRDWLEGKCLVHILQLEIVDLPDEIRAQFLQLREDLGFIKNGDKDIQTAGMARTIGALSELEVNRIVNGIVAMRDTIARHERMAMQGH